MKEQVSSVVILGAQAEVHKVTCHIIWQPLSNRENERRCCGKPAGYIPGMPQLGRGLARSSQMERLCPSSARSRLPRRCDAL